MIDHLLSRNYDVNLYVNQVIDHENKILTVYLNNLSGQFVGFQQYRSTVLDKKTNNAQEGRYFTHCQRGVTAVWGLETLDPLKHNLFIVEGIFKASTLHRLGFNALAVLTSNPKPIKSWLHTLNHRVIGIGDNDQAGLGMERTAGEGFRSELDLDEYSQQELLALLKEKGYA